MQAHGSRKFAGLAAMLPAVVAGACILQFESGLFQAMEVHFALSETLLRGESTLVHSVLYPHEVVVRNRWVRIAGAVHPPAGAAAPDQVAMTSRFEDAASSRLAFNLKANARIRGDGSFSVQKKIRKNLEAGTLQLISVEPRGADLVEGTKIWLCIDVVERRADLRGLPDCAAGATDGSPAAGTIVVEIRDNDFDPRRVRVQPGQTVRWVLTGANLNHTVTAMDESVFDSGFLSTPGAFFEVQFTEAHRDQTFEYFCRTHQSCCQMQGSVQVGENAPDPGEGY